MRDPRRMPRFQLLTSRAADRTLAEALCSAADLPGAASANLAAGRGPQSEIQAAPAPCPRRTAMRAAHCGTRNEPDESSGSLQGSIPGKFS